jgi:opacity protein-like surface antigen
LENNNNKGFHMKKLLCATCSFLCLLWTVAFAGYVPVTEDRVEAAGNWYGAIFGGGVLFENVNFLSDASSDTIRLKYEFGYAAGAALGYRILPYNLRFEGQYTYTRLVIDLGNDEVTVGAPVVTNEMVERVTGDGMPLSLEQTVTTTMTDGLGGHSIMHTPFFNAYYDFTQIGDRGHPYVGAGAGYSRVSFNIVRTMTTSVHTVREGATGVAATDTVPEIPAIDPIDMTETTTVKTHSVARPGRFAYQLVAGLLFGSDGDFTVDINYRYITFGKLSTTVEGVKFSPRRRHSVHMATIGFTFPINQNGL